MRQKTLTKSYPYSRNSWDLEKQCCRRYDSETRCATQQLDLKANWRRRNNRPLLPETSLSKPSRQPLLQGISNQRYLAKWLKILI